MSEDLKPSGFTPGPWEEDDYDKRRVSCAGRGEMLAMVWSTEKSAAECAANRRLIAAAPDQHAALGEVADGIEAQVPVTRAYLVANGIDPNFADVLLSHYLDHARTARAAIAKALGAATARSTGDRDEVPGTPPDTSWNKRASPPGGEWRWVPVEPTEEMLAAAKPAFKEVEDMILYCHARGSHRGGLQNGDPLPVAWKAMVSAAPPREAVGVGIEGASRTNSGGSPPLRAAKSERQQALDEAWRAVDALGGSFDTTDPRACGYDKALCDATKEIEKLGGRWS